MDTAVDAFLPRRLLSGKFGIMDPQDVKAALVVEGGGLSYLDGSLRYGPEEGQNLVGSGFERTPFKGHEPRFDQTAPYPGAFEDPDLLQHKIDDSIFAEVHSENGGESGEGEPSQEEPGEGEPEASNFDFDGDGLANSLLKVSFSANSFPAEVQFGDPWVDPYANLDSSAFGTITGSVQDTEGNHLDEFDIWFFKTSGGDASNNEAYEDDDVVFIVAGGDLSYPYYNIILESTGASVDFQSYALIKGKSYTFKAGDISPSHPFNIGSSFQNNSPQATGGPLDQNSQATNQSITVSIPADFEGSLSYFCTIHQSMMHQFIISDPSPEDNIGNNPDLGGENFDIYADEPVFFQLEYGENGTFTAKLPAGNYHAEAVAYDPETDTAYKPQIYGGFENPTIFEIDGNESSYSDINFALEAEFRMSYEFAEVQGIVQTTSDTDERIEVFFDLFPLMMPGND